MSCLVDVTDKDIQFLMDGLQHSRTTKRDDFQMLQKLVRINNNFSLTMKIQEMKLSEEI